MRLSIEGVEKPTEPLPEKIRWDLMLAKRWLENVEIQPPKAANEGKSSSVSFGFKNKARQVDALKEFAWTLKYVYLSTKFGANKYLLSFQSLGGQICMKYHIPSPKRKTRTSFWKIDP